MSPFVIFVTFVIFVARDRRYVSVDGVETSYFGTQ